VAGWGGGRRMPICACTHTDITHIHTHTQYTHTHTHTHPPKTLQGQGVDYQNRDLPEIMFYASYDNSFSLANMGVFVGEDVLTYQYLFLLYIVILLRGHLVLCERETKLQRGKQICRKQARTDFFGGFSVKVLFLAFCLKQHPKVD
jgi:hypothetical protein